MKVQLAWEQVISLIKEGQRIGNYHAAIDLAVEWIEAAGLRLDQEFGIGEVRVVTDDPEESGKPEHHQG